MNTEIIWLGSIASSVADLATGARMSKTLPRAGVA